MRALTERVIELSTRAAGDWWRSGLRLELSVNLPADVLRSPTRASPSSSPPPWSQSGLPATALQFEVTEDALMSRRRCRRSSSSG